MLPFLFYFPISAPITFPLSCLLSRLSVVEGEGL